MSRDDRNNKNKKPEVKPPMTRLNKWRLFLVCLAILCGCLFVGGCVADNKYCDSHSIHYTVLYNAGETYSKVQHKHTASLASETWIRVKCNETGVVRDFTISNPIEARSMDSGSTWKVRNPSIRDFSDYGFTFPWYVSPVAMLFLGVGVVGSLLILLMFCL